MTWEDKDRATDGQEHDHQRTTKKRYMLTSIWNAKDEIENDQDHFFVGPVDLGNNKVQQQDGGGNQRPGLF
jgi:hypothetical protein